MRFDVGPYTIDTDAYAVRCEDRAVAVEPQVFDILRLLIENRDRVVSKDELLNVVWNGRIVSEATLSSRIKAARQALGDDGAAQRLIRTVHGRGFRFVGDVVEQPPAQPRPPPSPVQDPRCTVAVLPMRNLGGDPALDMLSVSLAEDISTHLARMPGFLVISTNSTQRLAGERVEPASAFEQLGARYVVEGSLKPLGEKVRISVRLIMRRRARMSGPTRSSRASTTCRTSPSM